MIGNSAIYALGGLLPQAMNMFLLTVFARYLPPAEFGIISYTTGVCAFLALVGHLSVYSYVARFYFDCRNEVDRRRLFGGIFAFLAVYNTILLGIQFLVFPVLFSSFSVKVPFAPYMQLALWNNAFEVMCVVPLTYFRVREEAGRFIALTLSQTVISGVLSFYFVVMSGVGILGRYYGLLTSNMMLFVACLGVMRHAGVWSWDRAQVREAIAFSAPLGVAALLTQVVTMSDRLILERFVSLSQLGVYSVGFSVAYGINSISGGISKALEPQLYRVAAGSDLENRSKEIKRHMMVLLVTLGCLMITFSREILTILAGPVFRESYRITAMLSIAVVLQGVTVPFATYAVAVRKSSYTALAKLAGAGTSLGTNWLLIPAYGIYGAAIGSIAASLVTLYAYNMLTERAPGAQWRLTRDVGLMMVAFGASAIVLQIEVSSLLVSAALKALILVGAVTLLARRTAVGVRTLSVLGAGWTALHLRLPSRESQR